MSYYLFGNSTAYPEIKVELGVSDLASAGGVWGYSVWDTGTWTDTPVWSDVTQYVRALTTSWARSRELNRQPSNILNVVLSNTDARFSPGNVAATAPYAVAGVSKLRPRIAVRVTAVWNSITYPVYYGFVTNLQDDPIGSGKDMTATLSAVDALSLLTQNPVDGSAIGAQGDTCAVRLAAYLSAAAWPLSSVLDTGTSTLQVDATADSALTLVQDVAQSDGGLVYADRDGSFVFHSRTHRGPVVGTSGQNQVIASSGSITWSTQAGLSFKVGDSVLLLHPTLSNRWMIITVTAYSGTSLTGTITSANSVGSSLTSPNLSFARSTTTQITFGPSNSPYLDPVLSNDETYFFNQITVTPQGAYSKTSTTSLTIGTGSKAFTVASGLSFVAGNSVTATSAASSANFMTGTVASYSGTTLTVTVTTIGGSGTLADWTIAVNNVAQTVSDADSTALYGVRSLSVSVWCLNSQAAALATFLLSIFSAPEYRVDEVTVIPSTSPSSLWPLCLDARIDDRHSVIVSIPTTTYTSTITRAVHVAGISHSITKENGWRVTFPYSSATPYS